MTRGSWRDAMRAAFPGARFDEPMSLHTTFKIGGPADCYVELSSRGQLRRALELAAEHGVPWFNLGWGSNLLVRDLGVRGIVARLRGEFERLEFLEGARVRAGCGVRVPQLVSACAERGLGGDEPLVGIPGTVGGALVMNAGTRDGEIGALVESVSALEPKTRREAVLAAKDLHFVYRGSNLGPYVVLDCVLRLKPGDKGDIMAVVARYQQRRLQTQPIHTYNVGSTFKNPPGRFVAQLIEEAGLKGLVQGGARVSPMHANFIENFAGAKAADVLALVARIKEKVAAVFGVELELEMKVVGE